ncbi:GNAT family N-acetyltransferase [Paraurantiacibacter namhicola]|uniref:N-acetyltransferase domain-containing protein n=1 Tax=Paraurantiacibacter namhicola TaxID=645517 RepID=A0A1C7D5E0_9SPHN|nr:GNAT family protein [Paraurantiacibacter namhicola]ANU06684.1 hypothetical protein A6F65_00359 [Paraurantiacibacter namhicola]
MTTGPFLTTDRLELWRPTQADMRPMFAIISEPETGLHFGNSVTLDDHFMRFCRNAGSWALYGYGGLMVRERGGDGSLLGNCGIFHSIRGMGEDFDDRAEAGWILRHASTGKGYAEEAMRAILAWFDREYGQEVMCMVAPANTPSLKLADKLGFGLLRDTSFADGEEIRLMRRAPPARS